MIYAGRPPTRVYEFVYKFLVDIIQLLPSQSVDTIIYLRVKRNLYSRRPLEGPWEYRTYMGMPKLRSECIEKHYIYNFNQLLIFLIVQNENTINNCRDVSYKLTSQNFEQQKQTQLPS